MEFRSATDSILLLLLLLLCGDVLFGLWYCGTMVYYYYICDCCSSGSMSDVESCVVHSVSIIAEKYLFVFS